MSRFDDIPLTPMPEVPVALVGREVDMTGLEIVDPEDGGGEDVYCDVEVPADDDDDEEGEPVDDGVDLEDLEENR